MGEISCNFKSESLFLGWKWCLGGWVVTIRQDGQEKNAYFFVFFHKNAPFFSKNESLLSRNAPFFGIFSRFFEVSMGLLKKSVFARLRLPRGSSDRSQ